MLNRKKLVENERIGVKVCISFLFSTPIGFFHVFYCHPSIPPTVSRLGLRGSAGSRLYRFWVGGKVELMGNSSVYQRNSHFYLKAEINPHSSGFICAQMNAEAQFVSGNRGGGEGPSSRFSINRYIISYSYFRLKLRQILVNFHFDYRLLSIWIK